MNNIWIFFLFGLISLGIVAGMILVLTKRYFNTENFKRRIDLHEKTMDTVLPAKLQAYERLAMLLERSKPDALLNRLASVGSSASDIAKSMVITLQKEFEHNLSQQIYVSKDLWEIISLAKEQMQAFILDTQDLGEDLGPDEYRTHLMMRYRSLAKKPIDVALNALRTEVRTLTNTQ